MKKNNFLKFLTILIMLFSTQNLKSEIIIMSLCDDKQDGCWTISLAFVENVE